MAEWRADAGERCVDKGQCTNARRSVLTCRATGDLGRAGLPQFRSQDSVDQTGNITAAYLALLRNV